MHSNLRSNLELSIVHNNSSVQILALHWSQSSAVNSHMLKNSVAQSLQYY